jgi:hypothetical protein
LVRKTTLSVAFFLFALSCISAGAQAGTSDVGHYLRPNQKGPYKKRVIVFVHGMFGDSEGTWRNANGAYWPRMLLDDKIFDDSDIYVAAYPTSLAGNNITVAGEASILDNRLTRDEVFSKHQEVVFVCHSLGGIILQDLLLTHREYAEKVRFIYFFGTPQTGAQIAAIAHVFNGDPLLEAMIPGDQNAYLADMEQKWKLADFKTVRYCAYETKTYNSVLVVGYLSSTRNCDKSYLAIDENHVGLVKPSSRTHDSYSALVNAIQANPIAKLPRNNSPNPGTKPPTPNPLITQNCPGGNCIGGDNYGNPTVYNTPPPPVFTYTSFEMPLTDLDAQNHIGGKIKVMIKADREATNLSFALQFDGTIIGPQSVGIVGSNEVPSYVNLGTDHQHPDDVIKVSFMSVKFLPAGTELYVTVVSKEPVKFLHGQLQP